MALPAQDTADWRRTALERLDGIVRWRRLPRAARWLHHPLASPLNSVRMRLLNLLFSFAKVSFQPTVTTIFGDAMRLVIPSGYCDIWMYRAVVDVDSEVRLTRFMLRHLAEGATFFDVGSCLGYYSLLASHLVGPGGTVVAFEPSPYISPLLRGNVAARGNVRVVEKVVGADNAPVKFFIAPLPWIGTSSVIADWQPKSTEAVTAQATTLDDLCAAQGTWPDMMKIDAEGAEAQIISGARKLLREKSPVLVMEIFTPPVPTDLESLRLLRELGYSAFAIEDDGGLRALAYEDIEAYLAELRRRYARVHESPNDFDNMVFKRA